MAPRWASAGSGEHSKTSRKAEERNRAMRAAGLKEVSTSMCHSDGAALARVALIIAVIIIAVILRRGPCAEGSPESSIQPCHPERERRLESKDPDNLQSFYCCVREFLSRLRGMPKLETRNSKLFCCTKFR